MRSLYFFVVQVKNTVRVTQNGSSLNFSIPMQVSLGIVLKISPFTKNFVIKNDLYIVK